jgi:hypothetical protein
MTMTWKMEVAGLRIRLRNVRRETTTSCVWNVVA